MLHANGAPWVDVPLPAGTVAVLSLVMSNGRNSGQFVTTKPFVRCLPEEMKNEALAQIGLHAALKDVPYAIGPDLQFIDLQSYVANPQRYDSCGASKIDERTIAVSDGLLYVRMPQNLDNEPANFTDVHNFFIAGEFTRTSFAIPTMEKSCESGIIAKATHRRVRAFPGRPGRFPVCDRVSRRNYRRALARSRSATSISTNFQGVRQKGWRT